MTKNPFAVLAALVLAAATASSASEPAIGNRLTGAITTHVVARGDTLQALAARAGLDVQTLADQNDLRGSHVLVIGRRLIVDNRHIVPPDQAGAAIVVNLPQRMLFVIGRDVAGLPVAIGRRTWPTPVGEFQVATMETDPTWDVPASIRAEARRLGRSLPASVPPGPTNPLGHFWIGLTGGSVGIHGTNSPSSVYGAVTHGCMRLHPDDIEWLFPQVKIGASVRTVYHPVLLAEIAGQVLLEVHPDVYQREPVSLASIRTLATARGLDSRIDWTAAARVVALRHGVASDVSLRTGASP
jgi:L,D-transpeptidase ErfK/SrfK